MSKNFLNVSDGIRFKELASAPSSPIEGEVYYDTTLNKLRVYDGSAWQDLGSGSGGPVDAADVTFTPTGGISATDVQSAIAEVDTEKLRRDGGNTITGDLLPDLAATRTFGSIAAYFLNNFTRNVITNQVILGTSNLSVENGYLNGSTTGLPSGGTANVRLSGVDNLALVTFNKIGSDTSGPISVETGNTVNGNSGDISLRTGVPTGSGTRGKVSLDGISVDVNNKNIVNLADPTSIQHAATKSYVDGLRVSTNYIPDGNAETGVDYFQQVKEGPFLVTLNSVAATVNYVGHGFTGGEAISFTSLPGDEIAVITNTVYYVYNVTSSSKFQLVNARGSTSALGLTSNGSATLAYAYPKNNPTRTAGNLTIATNTTLPLAGTQDFLITKDGSNRMGHQIVRDFTIDRSARYSMLSIEFDYIVNSGSFVAGTSTTDGSMRVFIRDVINNKIIEPTNSKFLSNSSTVQSKFTAQFQATNSIFYELMFVVMSPLLATWAVRIDNVKVFPSSYVYGTPITDDQVINGITFTNGTKGTTSVDKITWHREGQYLYAHYEYRQTSAGSGSGDLLISLPAGLSFSSSVALVTTASVPSTDVNAASIFSNGSISDGTNSGMLQVIPFDSTRFRLSEYTNVTRSFFTSGSNINLSGAMGMSFTLKAPILGWSSSVQMSDQADTRVVDFTAYKTTSQSVTANLTNLSYTTLKDSHGGWDGTTYTVRVPGDYLITASGASSAAAELVAFVNGVAQKIITALNVANYSSGSCLLTDLKSGDVLSVRCSVTTTVQAANSTATHLAIQRLSGPSQIAASETVTASYYNSANKTVSTTQPLDFDTREWDSHGSVTTGSGWKFTCQSPGEYQINCFINFTGGSAVGISVYKNGTLHKPFMYAATVGATVTGGCQVKLNVGDYIDIRTSASSTAVGGALSTTASHLSITKVGNF